MKEDQQFFVAGKAFIEKDGKLLVLFHPIMGADFPGGKLQIGEEDIMTALKRETLEETGFEIEVYEPFTTWVFTIPLECKHRYAGRKVFSIGYRCAWKSGELRLSSEHTRYEWVDGKTYSNSVILGGHSHTLERYFAHKSKGI